MFHSLSKYLNGHSDVLMGCLATNRADLAELFKEKQRDRGLTPSSYECFLVERALVTFEVGLGFQKSNKCMKKYGDHAATLE